MVLPDRLRHQYLDGVANKVITAIAEQRFTPAIDITDHACPVHRDQGIRHRLKENLEVPLGLRECQASGRGLFPQRRHQISLRTKTKTPTLSLKYATKHTPPNVSRAGGVTNVTETQHVVRC